MNFCPSGNGRVDAKGAATSAIIVSVPESGNRVGNYFVVVPLVRYTSSQFIANAASLPSPFISETGKPLSAAANKVSDYGPR